MRIFAHDAFAKPIIVAVINHGFGVDRRVRIDADGLQQIASISTVIAKPGSRDVNHLVYKQGRYEAHAVSL